MFLSPSSEGLCVLKDRVYRILWVDTGQSEGKGSPLLSLLTET